MPVEGSPANVSGNAPPLKPWECVGSASGPAPFKPPSPGSTSDVVEASGTGRPGEIPSNAERNTLLNRNSLGKPVPARPWEQNYRNSYGGYGSSLNYNSSYGSGMFGSYGGSYGGGGGFYGNSMYGRPIGGMYGGGMYNSGNGGPVGGYGMGMDGPYGDQDPNNPFGAPSSPPGFWISFLRVMQRVVGFFGRIAILIDQNTQAFHMFMSALLQLFDRSGVLYGELARFVLRLLGIKTKSRNHAQPGPGGVRPAPDEQRYLLEPKPAGASWDSVWEADDKRRQ